MFNAKRGQVTIFVIIALVIVAGILIFFLFPQTNVFVGRGDVNPISYLESCIEPAIEEITPTLYSQGGYSSPSHSLLYDGVEIQYLCYTDEEYKPCKVMQPLILNHVQNEIAEYVRPRATQCVRDLEEQYERRGFEVTSNPGDVSVVFVPGSMVLDFKSPMTIRKENTQTFQKFSVSLPTEMYDLILTATSIIQFESTAGDSESTLYYEYYPDLKIEKIKRDDDTIYTLTNVVSEESFTFATRSLVWPTGYGIN